MKKEDAIEILESMAMAESTFSDEESKKSCEAIDIAIKALKREEAKCDVSLTLEQLRNMDGKPVWVDFTGSKIEQEPGWFILKYMNGQEAHLVGKVNTYRAYEYYGKTWLAYAYPSVYIDLEAWEPCENCNPRCAICANYGGWDRYGKPKICEDCKSLSNFIADDEFCSYCGRPLTPKARDKMKKMLWREI